MSSFLGGYINPNFLNSNSFAKSTSRLLTYVSLKRYVFHLLLVNFCFILNLFCFDIYCLDVPFIISQFGFLYLYGSSTLPPFSLVFADQVVGSHGHVKNLWSFHLTLKPFHVSAVMD